ncbi:MAG: cation:proton antiporter [Gemmatimonadales bacterium]|nr:cation:proton antiporter [Gemmatimonadales bacterium]
MNSTVWFLFSGVLLVFMAIGSTLLKRLPLTPAMLCLGAGVALGPAGAGLFDIAFPDHSRLLEHVTEVAVVISLFTVGLKLRVLLTDPRWRVPLRLAVISMVLTVGLVTVVGVLLLGLPLGAAVLLGGILAPTDPVLASDVQVESPWDPERLRFSLSAEGGLNDGTAFPFVMLGLGLLGARDLGPGLWRWLTLDVLWAVGAGLAIGGMLGTALGRLVLYLRREHREGLGADEFLALGLIALAYGAAVAVEAYGFLAVFAAGVAFRQVESRETGADSTAPAVHPRDERGKEELEVDPVLAPRQLAQTVLTFNEQLDRLGEVAVVLLVGGLLPAIEPAAAAWIAVALLLLVIRPVSTSVGLAGLGITGTQRRLIAWFGIRGIGSIYYLTYAVNHGLPEPLVGPLSTIAFLVVAVSIVVHGISATPLMIRYTRRARVEEAH